MCSKVLQHVKLATPMKMNMEPETWTMEEEIHVGKTHFQVPCSFQGVYFQRKKSNRSQEDTSNIPKSKYERIPFIPTGAKVSGFGVCSDNCVYFKGFFCKSKNHRRGFPPKKTANSTHNAFTPRCCFAKTQIQNGAAYGKVKLLPNTFK